MKKYIYLSFCYIFLLGFISCTDDTENPTPGEDENTPPVADAGPDLQSNSGSTVTLDGSASSDVDEDDLSYLWEVSTKPAGSNVSINNHTTAIATFIPDEPGTYTITLTVNDGTDSDTDETLVEVEGDPMETVEVNSNIDEDVVWEDIFDNPDMPDYYVTRGIDVNARLTINPGVVVHMAEQAVITVESGGGTLIAEGAEDNKIVFTSFDEAGEIQWGGILINSSSSQNVLDHVNFAFSGGADLIYLGSGTYASAIVAVNESARLNITNTHFTKSASDGLFVLKSGNLPSFSNNTFSEISGFPMSLSVNQIGMVDDSNTFGDDAGSGSNVVRIYDSVLEEDQEWSALNNNTAYLFQGDVTVKADLTIREGTFLKFDEGVVLNVSSEGVLKALGTADNKVVFTSSGIADGKKWGGILINSTSINNELDHVQVAHAGGDPEFIYFGGGRYEAGSIGVVNNARLTLTNSEISDSRENGLIIYSDGSLEGFAANAFHNNGRYPLLVQVNMLGMLDESTVISGNSNDVVAVYASDFDEGALFSDEANPVWVALDGDARYLFTDKLTVKDDLTIAEGATLAFTEDAWVEVASAGSLKAVGSAANRIHLTAFEQDGNHNWGGIIFHSANSNNQIEYAEVSYGGARNNLYVGGGVYLPANVAVGNNASLSVNNALISHSKGYGIAIHSGGAATIGTEVSYNNNDAGDMIQD